MFLYGIIIVCDILLKLGCSPLNVLQNRWFKQSNKSAITWQDYHNINFDQMNISHSITQLQNQFIFKIK